MMKYILKVFLIAVLAVHLIVLYASLEVRHITTWYVGLLMFHTPVWIFFLVIGNIFIKLKLQYSLFIISSGVLIFLQLIAVYQKNVFNFDFLALYYLISYIFCFSLFAVWQTNKTKL
jgi:hypothetical protein